MRIKEYLQIYLSGKTTWQKIIDGFLFFIFIDLFVYIFTSLVMLLIWFADM